MIIIFLWVLWKKAADWVRDGDGEEEGEDRAQEHSVLRRESGRPWLSPQPVEPAGTAVLGNTSVPLNVPQRSRQRHYLCPRVVLAGGRTCVADGVGWPLPPGRTGVLGMGKICSVLQLAEHA